MVNTTSAPQPKNQCLVTDKPEPIEKIIPSKTKSHIVIKAYPSPLGVNCVNYARSKGNVPQGVGSLSQKISKIQSREPKKGKIGVTKEGSVGHLIYVEEVRPETLVISEGNWLHGYISFREVPKSLILGFL